MDFDHSLDTISPTLSTGVITTTGAAVRLPVGTTVQRPAVPVKGDIRYNDTLAVFEIFDTKWESIARQSDGPQKGPVFNYNPDGSLGSIAYANGSTKAFTYASGNLSRLVQVVNGSTKTKDFTYSGNQRLLQITETVT
jgi:hypothetical protein